MSAYSHSRFFRLIASSSFYLFRPLRISSPFRLPSFLQAHPPVALSASFLPLSPRITLQSTVCPPLGALFPKFTCSLLRYAAFSLVMIVISAIAFFGSASSVFEQSVCATQFFTSVADCFALSALTPLVVKLWNCTWPCEAVTLAR